MFGGESYWFAKVIFQRGLAFLYLIEFVVAFRQYTGLVGENGILPVKDYIEDKSLVEAFSIFYFSPRNLTMNLAALTGIALSLVTLTGFADFAGNSSYVLTWGLMWLLFLSFKNTGQEFYRGGLSLIEAGFFAIYLGSQKLSSPILIVILMRWFLFRMIFGSGLVKIKKDPGWKNLTALENFFEIQKSPGPLSWYLDKLPGSLKKIGDLLTMLVLLVFPFFYFAPQPYAAIAGLVTILFQAVLILSGNFYWLNFLTILLALFTFNDQLFIELAGLKLPEIITYPYTDTVLLVGVLTVFLSIGPVISMIRSRNFAATSYNIMRIVNTYGRYPRIPEQKHTIVIEGFSGGEWREYVVPEIVGPCDRRPRQVAPYTHRIKNQFWSAAYSPEQYDWLERLLEELLENNEEVTELLRQNPFDEPPEKVRARLFRYEFTSIKEKKQSGNWWKREPVKTLIQKSRE